jgi:hypothetical protein
MRENKLKFAMYCIITSFMFILAMYLIVGIIFPKWSFSIILGSVSGSSSIFTAYKLSLNVIILLLCVDVIVFIFGLMQVIKGIKRFKN